MRTRDEHEILVQASVDLVRATNSPGRVHEDPQGFFEASGVTPEHAKAWSVYGEKRLLLYRKLVRNGLRTAIRKLIPHTATRLGSAFDPWVDRFCDEEMPRSHRLRDVATEFVDWVCPQWKRDASIPVYLADLARFEVFEFAIAIAVTEHREAKGTELQLDKSIVFDASVRMAHFDHAVQRLDEDEADVEIPAKESTWLLGYRDSSYEVELLELNGLAASILERLLAGQTLGDAVVTTCGGAPPLSVLESIAQLLADLAERNVLLGAG